MYEYLMSCSIMHRNAAILTILCILLCLTFNYTFPLHREGSNWFIDVYDNRSRICARTDHHDSIKKITNRAHSAFKRLKDPTQDISKNIQAHLNTGKNSLSDEDLRQYEQLVIMKKYPYLDLKEIELNYNGPFDKNTRQTVKYNVGGNVGDPSFCSEPSEEVPNVEIINRGLTGFAIPAKIIKTNKQLETKLKSKNNKDIDDSGSRHNIKLAVISAPRVLGSLRDDVVYYAKNNFNKH